ncbi:colicin transporter [Trinickia symbiotica]
MFRCPPMTLQISRFPAYLRAAMLGAAFVAAPLAASAQTMPAAGGANGPHDASKPADDMRAASAATSASDFDARQKVLDTHGAQNQYEYGVAVHNCYDRFFVNACIGRARDKMRETQARIHAEQLQLDDERRAAHAQARDEREALKAASDAAEASQRAATDARNAESYAEKQRQHELDVARRNAEAPQRAANQAAYDQKQSDYQRKLEQARQQAAQDAKERAERARRFAEKQADAAQHKADVEARQKQAEQKAQEKQQEQLQQQEQQKSLRKEQQEAD